MKKWVKRKISKLIIFILGLDRRALYDLIEEYLLSAPKYFGSKDRVFVSEKTALCNTLFNCASGKIVVNDYVFFGHNVSVIAATHDHSKFGLDRMTSIPMDGHDIEIGEGSWIGSNSTIIGPCRIGKNAVIAAGSLVINDVGDFEIVGGVPAKFIKKINIQNNEI